MTDLRAAAQQALTILEAWKHKGMWGDWDGVTDTLRAALAEPVECPHGVTDGNCKECYEQSTTPRKPLTEQEPQCNPHPKAPHGFLRNASHNEHRYVCECEGWEPYEAGYQAGMEAVLRAQS